MLSLKRTLDQVMRPSAVIFKNRQLNGMCDGAGARHLVWARYRVRGSLRTWHIYIDVASLPSLTPHFDIFIIQHLFSNFLWHFFMFFFINLVTALKSSSYSSSSNYLVLSVPALGLYVNFYSEVRCIHYCYLFRNFGYPYLAYYAQICLLNSI